MPLSVFCKKEEAVCRSASVLGANAHSMSQILTKDILYTGYFLHIKPKSVTLKERVHVGILRRIYAAFKGVCGMKIGMTIANIWVAISVRYCASYFTCITALNPHHNPVS